MGFCCCLYLQMDPGLVRSIQIRYLQQVRWDDWAKSTHHLTVMTGEKYVDNHTNSKSFVVGRMSTYLYKCPDTIGLHRTTQIFEICSGWYWESELAGYAKRKLDPVRLRAMRSCAHVRRGLSATVFSVLWPGWSWYRRGPSCVTPRGLRSQTESILIMCLQTLYQPLDLSYKYLKYLMEATSPAKVN